ncbi:unnamed protein product, partial [Effrenium voratum]
ARSLLPPRPGVPGAPDAWPTRRQPQHRVDFVYQEARRPQGRTAAPTDLSALTQPEEEGQPWSVLRGTKDAVLRGRRRFNGAVGSHNRKPCLPLSGLTGGGFAVSDPWGDLE